MQVLESPCNRSSCLQHTRKEAVKQAQLYRALSGLSGQGFNFIQMCPELSVFSTIYSSSLFFLCILWILLHLNEGTQLKTGILEAPPYVTKKKKSMKTEKQQPANKACISLCQTSGSTLLLSFSLPGWLFALAPKLCPTPQDLKDSAYDAIKLLLHYVCETRKKNILSWKTCKPCSNLETKDSLL